ncbi:BREX-2 system phosphatase PglZ [Nocardiopsis sp. NPDC050513]|uniref:BREX-2 system phosphatase PglZ n=1 Tax=Nocardiopsis sp. NPDC050513 TaxID=3364338 RepID=UPI0037B44E7C
MTAARGAAHAPTALGRVNAEAVTSALQRALEAEQRRVDKGHRPSAARALALSADPRWEGPDTLAVRHGDTDLTVRVAGADSVLAIVRALSLLGEDVDHLVVLTPIDPADFGEALLGRFLGEDVTRLGDWELLATDLKVTGIDPRLYSGRWSWLAHTLRGIRATRQLRLGTGVLKLEQALSIAVSVRFGREPGEQVDSAALLEWTRDPHAVAAFTRLGEDERDELRAAAVEALGAVPRVLFTLLDRGHALDAIPVGLALGELARAARDDRPGEEQRRGVANNALIRAQERYFGLSQPAPRDLDEFGKACVAALLRQLDLSDPAHADGTVRRSEELLHQLDAGSVAEASGLLDAGLHSRMADLGRAVGVALGDGDGPVGESLPLPQDLREVEEALTRLSEHRRHAPDSRSGLVAVNAVRLLRRLAAGTAAHPLGTSAPTTTRGWVHAHVRDTGWVDRAASLIWHHHTEVPVLDQALAALYHRVRAWRALVDAEFAAVVNRWNGGHSPTDEQPRSENLLAHFARPLATGNAPLVIVLDGMSAEVAVQLAEHVNARGRLVEIGRQDAEGAPARAGALATVPSTTTCSRASLLTGTLTTGKQDTERKGFRDLWASAEFGRRDAVLYHQRDLEAGAGQHLPTRVQAHLEDTGTVVGVVLNTIDDALAKGREGNDPTWRPEQVGALASLLDAAARVGRPVLLTSDHGHVWDRREARKTQAGESARYRTGQPGDGEVLATGDRVLVGDGSLVVPYREDIRYTDRKEGYHGGFSAAEMVIPVLAFIPVLDRAPQGWSLLSSAEFEPAWWSQPLEGTAAPAAEPGAESAAVRKGRTAAGTSAPDRGAAGGRQRDTGAARPRPKSVPDQTPALFGNEDLTPDSLGARVTATAVFEASLARVAKAPSAREIGAVIDALVAAGGTHPRLPVGAAARAAGKSEAPHRAVRFLKMVSKVLNVESYPVLTLTDGDRGAELNTSLLHQQFLSEGS